MRKLTVRYNDGIPGLMREILELKINEKLVTLDKSSPRFIQSRVKLVVQAMGLCMESFHAERDKVEILIRVHPEYRSALLSNRVSSRVAAVQSISRHLRAEPHKFTVDTETGGIQRVHDSITVKVDPALSPDRMILQPTNNSKPVIIENIAERKLGAHPVLAAPYGEAKDDACRRICKSLLDGHSHGCPYAKEGR